MASDRPIRLLLTGPLAFGPGKAELLEKIAELGSLQAAAGAMDMSYMKAWKLVKSLNEAYADPLVLLSRGGKRQGGASLTPTGREILDLYRQALAAAERAVAPMIDRMNALRVSDDEDSSNFADLY